MDNFDFMANLFSAFAFMTKKGKEMTIDDAIEIMTYGSDRNKEVETMKMSSDIEKQGHGIALSVLAQGMVARYAKEKRAELGDRADG